MRIFGSVHSCFWSNPDTQNLNDQSKLLAIYLLTGPHTNMIGCFRLPDGYITEDLKWPLETVSSAFEDLTNINFLTRDQFYNWLVIHDFLKWNPIQNPKQAKGAERLFTLTPIESSVLKPLRKGLLTYGKYFEEGFRNRLETLSVSGVADKNKSKNKEQDKNSYMSGKPDDETLDKTIQLKKDATEVLEFLNKKTNKAYRPVDNNLNLIVGRLKTGATVMDCRQVIAKKMRDWKDDKKMVEYLRPATLFNPLKFEQYMGELVMKDEEGVR